MLFNDYTIDREQSVNSLMNKRVFSSLESRNCELDCIIEYNWRFKDEVQS
jgi:hypothetical protein